MDHLGVGAVRWLVALILVAGLPLADEVPLDDRLAFGYGMALLWVPAAGFLQAMGRRRSSVGLTGVAVAVDLAPFVLSLWALPDLQVLAVPCLLILLWYWSQVAGLPAAIAGGMALALSLVLAVGAGGPVVASLPHAVTLAALIAAMVWLSGGTLARRHVVDRQAARMASRSGALLTGVAEAIVITSPGGRIREWNQAAERTFAIARSDAQAQLCHEVLQLRHGLRDLHCTTGCALLQLADQTGQNDHEIWRQLDDGRRQPLLAHVSAVHAADGAILDVVHSLRDVTRMKEAEEAKTMFLATASHELKTPLTVIEGFAEMLASHPDPDSPNFELAINAIVTRSGDLRRHVERLLLTSRIDAGRLSIQRSPMEVSSVVVTRARDVVGANGRELLLDVRDDLPLALAELYALETVVEHLIENAVKYSPDGGPVEVGIDHDAQHVVVSIADRGVGMTPDEVARCFERFWQADASNARRFNGSGIGLYVVHSLVEAMAGRVEVESEVGVGSRFSVWLQRADVDHPDLDDDDEAARPRAPEPSIIREFMRQVGVSTTLGGGT